jgi:hypothetical protein
MSQPHLLSFAASAFAGALAVRFGGGTAGTVRPDGRGISQ